MNRAITSLLLFGAVLLCAAPMSSAAPITVPADLQVGDTYRLVFVTSTRRDALSSDIADYNAFVSGVAATVPELAALGTTWKAIASTASIAAIDNTGTTDRTYEAVDPIYRLDGIRIAQNNYELWPFIGSPGQINTVENGTLSLQSQAWTGTGWNGQPRGPLGFRGNYPWNYVSWGLIFSTSIDSWLNEDYAPAAQTRSFYAISGPLTVVPEPSTIVLAGLAATGLAAPSLRRRRQRRSQRHIARDHP